MSMQAAAKGGVIDCREHTGTCCGLLWCVVGWCDVVWFVRYGIVWCGMVWCGVEDDHEVGS